MEIEQTQTQSLPRHQVWQLRSLSNAWIAPISTAGFWMLLIWAIHRNSPRTLVSFHGLLHAAIAGRFLGLSTVSFPPENPFFAGQPIAYYWFFQFLAAQLTRLLGINIFYSFEILILIGIGTLMIGSVLLGRKLYDSTLSGILIGYLIVAGTNPLGWLHVVNALVREGTGVLNDNSTHLWGVVHPLYSLIRYNDVGGIYGPLLNFFLNITSRPAALASLLVTLLCLEWLLRSRRVLAWVALSFAWAMTTALSPVIGITTGGALLFSLGVCWLWDKRVSRAASKLSVRGRQLLYAGLAICVGLLVAGPTFYHLVIGPGSSHAQFSLLSIDGFRHVVAVTLSIALLVILALVGLFRTEQHRRMYLWILISSAFVLLGLNVTITLTSGNGSNLFHAAVVLLAVPAAGSIVRIGSIGNVTYVNKRLATGIFVVFLPTVLLLLASYVQRPPLGASLHSQNISRMPVDSDLHRLYRWAQDETDPTSIFIIDPRERIAVAGNTTEFPAMTNRVIFTEDYRHYIAEPYPDSRERFELAVRFVSAQEPKDVDIVYLSRLNRPVYVVSDHSDDRILMSRMQELHGSAVFQAGTISVYRWLNK